MASSPLISLPTYTISNSIATRNKLVFAVNPQLVLKIVQRTNVFYNNKPTNFFELSSVNGSLCIIDEETCKKFVTL